MIIIAALLLGIWLGWRKAGRLGGNRRDRLQYAASFALALVVPALLLTVILDRML